MLGEYRLPSTATLKLLPAGAGSALRSSGTALEFFRRRDADAARRESQLNTALRPPGPLRFGALATPGRLEVLRDDPLGVYYRLTEGESVALR